MFAKKFTTFIKQPIFTKQQSLTQQLLLSTLIKQPNSVAKLKTNSIAKLKKYFAQKKNIQKETQLDRYVRHNAPPEILKLVKLNGGPALGTECEKIARYFFNILECKLGPDHDHVINANGEIIKIEQKSSTIIKNSSNILSPSDFLWQHIEPDNSWNFLLLCAVDHDGIKFYMMSKDDFFTLVLQGKITKQGGKNSYQGYWTTLSKIKYSIELVNNSEDIKKFIEKANKF